MDTSNSELRQCMFSMFLTQKYAFEFVVAHKSSYLLVVVLKVTMLRASALLRNKMHLIGCFDMQY